MDMEDTPATCGGGDGPSWGDTMEKEEECWKQEEAHCQQEPQRSRHEVPHRQDQTHGSQEPRRSRQERTEAGDWLEPHNKCKQNEMLPILMVQLEDNL